MNFGLGLPLALLLVVPAGPVTGGDVQTSDSLAELRFAATSRRIAIAVDREIHTTEITITALLERWPDHSGAIPSVGNPANIQPTSQDAQASQQALHADGAIAQGGTTRAARMRAYRAAKALERREIPLVRHDQTERECLHVILVCATGIRGPRIAVPRRCRWTKVESNTGVCVRSSGVAAQCCLIGLDLRQQRLPPSQRVGTPKALPIIVFGKRGRTAGQNHPWLLRCGEDMHIRG